MTSGSFNIFPVALERVVTAAARTVAFVDAEDDLLSNKLKVLVAVVVVIRVNEVVSKVLFYKFAQLSRA